VLLGALLKGLAALLVTGGLLALTATWLPRLLRWWEGREAARLGLEVPAPVLPVREQAAAPPEALASGAGAPDFRPPFAGAPAAPAVEAEEPLVAAAIALALTLYQEEQRPLPALAGGAGPSPWSLAGRWGAMERRLNLPKR
jgi:hypothetical protein